MRAATTLYSRFEPAGAPLAAPAAAPWPTARPGPSRRPAGLPPAGDAAAAPFTGHPALDAELPGGWPQGQLIELLLDAPGPDGLALLAPALAAMQAGQRPCLWVLPVASKCDAGSAAPPCASVLQAAGIDTARCRFVRPATGRASWWALEQALRAGRPGAVIGWLPEDERRSDADFRALRRLHLLAAGQRVLLVVLRAGRHAAAPSPAALRLHLTARNGQLQARVLKRNGRPLLDAAVLQLPAAARRSPAPAPAVRPPAAPTTAARPAASARRWLQTLFAPLRGERPSH